MIAISADGSPCSDPSQFFVRRLPGRKENWTHLSAQFALPATAILTTKYVEPSVAMQINSCRSLPLQRSTAKRFLSMTA